MSSENQIEIAKATKQSIVNDLCNTIDLQRQTNKGRVPRSFVAGLLRSHMTICPWLTRDALNNELYTKPYSVCLYSVCSYFVILQYVNIVHTQSVRIPSFYTMRILYIHK